MGRLFGTDGVRGVANQELTAELALALGAAAARRLTSPNSARRRVAVIGRDPRASGEMLEAAVIAVDGGQALRERGGDVPAAAEQLGRRVAARLLGSGAGTLITAPPGRTNGKDA